VWSYREKLQEELVLPIAELKLKDTIRAHLRNLGQPSRLEELAQACDEDGRRGGCRSGEVREVAAKAGIDEELLLVVGLGELEQQDLRGEVVDICQSKAHQALLKLVSNDLFFLVSAVRTGACEKRRSHGESRQLQVLTHLDIQRRKSLLHDDDDLV
jgi:hypothetical protein